MVAPSLNSHNLSQKSIKFLCSYGGRILPRYPDGKLRYHGGETRVLSVDRSVSFAELMIKLGEMCGMAVNMRCQLPGEDLDALISITSDEDLTNLIDEYNRAAVVVAQPASPSPMKIRAFLSGPKSPKKVSPTSSSTSSSADATSPRSPFCSAKIPPRCTSSVTGRYVRHNSRPPVYPVFSEKAAGKMPRHQYAYGNCGHVYVIHNGNHWQ